MHVITLFTYVYTVNTLDDAYIHSHKRTHDTTHVGMHTVTIARSH